VQEDIGTLQISMEYLDVMEWLQAPYNLNKYFPYIVLLNVLLVLLMGSDFLEQISIVRVLHYNTKGEGLELETKLLLTTNCC